MTKQKSSSGREVEVDVDQLIVSKTDPHGKITYCNNYFLAVSGYSEKELIGAPHAILRHPDMPRCVFKLMWEVIAGGREIFAYIVNRCKNGDHYWVLAHVTPSFDPAGRIIGYHSNRRAPDRALVRTKIVPWYKELRDEEARHDNRKAGLAASAEMIAGLLARQGVNYDELIARL